MNAQNRQPSRVPGGVPTGGQFATSAREEADVNLDVHVDAREETYHQHFNDEPCGRLKTHAAHPWGERPDTHWCIGEGEAAREARLHPPAPAEPKRYTWSTDDTKVKPPKAAVAFVADAEDCGYEVEVTHDAHSVQVYISKPDSQNRMGVTWTAGSFHDSAPSRLDFHTTPGRPGVRFNYAEGFAHGQWVTPKSARQARLYMNLPEKPTER